MRTQLSDTNPKIEDIQINLMQQKSVPQKFAVIDSLSSLTIRMSKRAIARKNPNLSKRELNLLFVKFNYGEELYEKVSKHLPKSSHEDK